MDKETYLKQKINNFIIFIEQKIGKDNIIYSDFTNYHNNIKLFLSDFVKLINMEINAENIQKYLTFKNIDKKIEEIDLNKIKRYFEMFKKVINL